MGVCNCSMFCCTLLYVHSSTAIILMGKRELTALFNLSSWCLVMVEWLFLAVPWGCLRLLSVVIPDHTHLILFKGCCVIFFIFIQIKIQHFSSKQWRPDQIQRSVASDLGLHCLPMSHKKDARLNENTNTMAMDLSVQSLNMTLIENMLDVLGSFHQNSY